MCNFKNGFYISEARQKKKINAFFRSLTLSFRTVFTAWDPNKSLTHKTTGIKDLHTCIFKKVTSLLRVKRKKERKGGGKEGRMEKRKERRKKKNPSHTYIFYFDW